MEATYCLQRYLNWQGEVKSAALVEGAFDPNFPAMLQHDGFTNCQPQPSAYLQQLQTHEHVQLTNESMDDILQSHAIPPEYLRTDDFEGFLAARQQTLLKKIETAMDKPIFFAEEVAEPEAAEVG
jgi:hypothetical protein